MPSLGVPELLIILAIFVLIFGVGKLPQIGKALGQGLREFREATQGLAGEDTSEASTSEGGEGWPLLARPAGGTIGATVFGPGDPDELVPP